MRPSHWQQRQHEGPSHGGTPSRPRLRPPATHIIAGQHLANGTSTGHHLVTRQDLDEIRVVPACSRTCLSTSSWQPVAYFRVHALALASKRALQAQEPKPVTCVVGNAPDASRACINARKHGAERSSHSEAQDISRVRANKLEDLDGSHTG
jgi:hypothetical protein